MRWCALLSCSLLLLAHTTPGQATPLDDTTRNAARELAHRGSEAFAAGDYATATDLFRRSYALVPAPTLSLREARSLDRMGRLVEAAEAYVRTVRTPIAADSPPVFADAVRDAGVELAQLRPRIPRLKIVLPADLHEPELRVTLDGKALPDALLGVEMPVNPGSHEIIASSPRGHYVRALVEAPERSSQQVDLEPRRAFAPATPRIVDRNAQRSNGFDQRSWSYVAFGVGAVGLGVGVVTGFMAADRHEDAERKCPGGVCADGSSGAEDVEAFRDLRTVSTLGYVTALVGAGAGLTLLVLEPTPQNTRTGRRVAPVLGLGSVGVSGRF